MSEYMLTTVDNPYDPFTEFDAWLGFDVSKGYNTCAYLARVAVSSDELSEEEESEAVGRRTDTCNSLSVLASWTISGLGIGYLPVEHFGRDIRAGRLRIVDVTPNLPDLEYVAALDRRHPQPLAQSVAELAVTVSTFERRTQLPETAGGRTPAPIGARRKKSPSGDRVR